MYKLIIPLFFALLSINAQSKPKKFMLCLGQEEASFHKNKVGGYVYKLNQDIISALVQLRSSIEMDKKFTESVCSARHPSLKVLEYLMIGEEVFKSNYSKMRSPRKFAIDQSNLDELREHSATLFIKFVTHIQSSLPKANCIQKKIPELVPFFEQMQYILQDVGIKRVMDSIKEPKKVFKKLQKLNPKQIKC